MRVAMYYNNNDVRLEELPRPVIGPGEALIQVRASGICGSDVMEWYRIKKAPIVLGHEVTGDIVELGEGVEGFAVGERVVFTHHVPCNNCYYCQRGEHSLCETLHNTRFYPGGNAEYVRLPQINIEKGGMLRLPENVSYDEGTFIEPLGCVIRGMRKMDIQPSDSVLVLGSGLSGLLNIKAAIAMGAGRVVATDINDYRLAAARQAGADVAINALEGDVVTAARAANDGRGFDIVIVCTAAPMVFGQALELADKGATMLLFAINTPGTEIPFEPYALYHKGVTLTSTYAAAPRDLREAMTLIASGRIEVASLITHRLPLDETQKGFQMTARAESSLKVIIDPTLR
ncbi:MAG: alcohol dehydrogenase [Clostridia bacterium]|nr:MAG: alcohol dehydrogenase [Clostridia bacterium]